MSTDCISSVGAENLHYPVERVGYGAEDSEGWGKRISALEGHIDW